MKEKKENIWFRQGHKLTPSGITLPEVHRVDKGIDPNAQPGKQVKKSIVSSEVKGVTQIKPRLGQVEQVLNESNLIHPHYLINPYNQQETPFYNNLKILQSQKQHQKVHFQSLDPMKNLFQHHKQKPEKIQSLKESIENYTEH